MRLSVYLHRRIMTCLRVSCFPALFIICVAGLVTAVTAVDAEAASTKGAVSTTRTSRTAVEARNLRWAEQGNAAAQYNLGLMYDQGKGVKQDRAEAARWYRRAAEQGILFAQYNLGALYDKGEGVKQNHMEAAEWYLRAAEQGHVDAQYSLGLIYSEGRGVKQDYTEASRWCRKAAEQKHAAAQFLLADIYSRGNNDAEAVEWYRRMAQQGKARAQHDLAVMYANGRGVERDYAEAVKWWRQAAMQGEPKAQLSLGMAYKKGEGIAQDYAEALKWFQTAADRGSPDAQCHIGLMYADGLGVKRDKKEAVKWLRKATEQGHITSMYLLGYMYSFGVAVEQDYTEAAIWYRMAAEAVGNVPDTSEYVYSTGTGFFISSQGLVLTSQHVVSAAKKVRVKTPAGLFPARVIAQDDEMDIAVLKVDQDIKFAALSLVQSPRISLGDEVFTIGFPDGKMQDAGLKYAEGAVDDLTGPANNPRFFQIEADVLPGNLGGPIFDTGGNVIGVLNAKRSNPVVAGPLRTLPQDRNYAVRSSFILPHVKNLPSFVEMPRSKSMPAKSGPSVAIDRVRGAVVQILCY